MLGDTLFQLISFGTLIVPVLLVIFIIIFVIRIVRRMERRADERLKIDKENTNFQQQQIKAIHDLNNRLTNIEKILKEVD